jgi:hypothetical protein
MTTPPLIGFSATTDPATLNGQAGALAVRWIALAQDTSSWAAWFHVLDEADVEAKFGIDSDHAAALTYAIGLMTTLAGVVHGTVPQGTPAELHDFVEGLRVLAGPGPLPAAQSG